MRRACVLLAHATFLVLASASSAFSAEWQLKPFIGVTYGGSATYNFVPQPNNRAGFAFGVTGVFLG